MTAQQLKNSILQEAISGRLVPQDPNDEPASALLQRIRQEKAQLVKQGKLKKKDLEEKPISDEEKPFDIPDSWEWVRLSDVVNVIMGQSPDGKDVYDAQGEQDAYEFHQGKIFFKEKYIAPSGKWCENPSRIAEIGSLLVCVRAPIGDVNITQRKIGIGRGLAAIMGYDSIKTDFLYFWMLSHKKNLVDKGTGTTFKAITVDTLRDLPIPLPPLAEQKRIVAKIEELLPKVEEYGKAQEALDKLNSELPERLKKSTLQEAISGRLVPQDAADEPASALLQRIRQEKAQLVKQGKLKKKDLEETPISDEDKPFDIPDSWEWVRLGELGIFERGSGIRRDETTKTGFPCVRYGEMYTHYRKKPTFRETISFTSENVFDKCRKARHNDIFMALTGENKEEIALASVYVGNEEIAVGGDLCHFTMINCFPLFFVYFINSPLAISQKQLLATGDIICHISTDKIGSIMVPLPPLAEQKRIVAKIEELFAQIELLKQ